jgi:flagellar hook-basal body complex protein FliE
MAIDPVSMLRMPPSPSVAAPAVSGFADALGQIIASTEASTAGANQAITAMVHGTGDVHDAMIAMHEAQTTFELTMQVRNKLIQAYQDVMRMTI